MQVTILGTGAAVPVAGRYQTGVLLEGEETLLVDCGSGVLHRLVEAGVDLADIDRLLVTHRHLDHVADVPSLLKARFLAGHEEFSVVGPPGTREKIDALLGVDDFIADRSVPVREIEPGEHTVAGFDVEARRTAHSVYCLAYRVGDWLTFSADTEATESVARLADGCQVLLHDCAFTDDQADPTNHATPTDLGRTLAGADVDLETVYLTHLYPDAAERAETLRETVASAVDAEVRVATDLETITFSE